MKRFMFLLILPVLCIPAFFGCTEGSNEPQGDLETQIKTAFYNSEYCSESYKTIYAEPDNIPIKGILGIYGDSVVVDIMSRPNTAMAGSEYVDGIQFTYPYEYYFLVYNDGEMYRLQEAFDAGLLDHDDVVDLKENTLYYKFRQ